MEYNDLEFEEMIEKCRLNELKKFEEILSKKRITPTITQNIIQLNYLREIDTKLKDLSKEFEVYNLPYDIVNIWENDNTLSYIDAIRLYCTKNEKQFSKIFEYEYRRKGLNRFYEELSLRTVYVFDETDINAPQSSVLDDKNSEFTLRRKILALIYLFKREVVETDFDTYKKNLTKISSFAEFMFADSPNPNGVRNTQYYKFVNQLYTKTGKAIKDDLIYVKDQFVKVGLTKLADEVESDIQSK
jgi:hypothetical protein